nr:peptidoglycan-binding domain-containing protein [Sedimentibacter sp.]
MGELINTINDNTITKIQIYLKEISKYRPEIIVENTDGVFDSGTKKAITKFQEIYGMQPTGTIDLSTWTKMIYEYNKYSKMNNTPNKLDCFPSNISEIKLDDEKDIVYIIQILLNGFSKKYKNFKRVDITGIYDNETEDAIKKFQTINKLPVTGIVDIKTWNSLSSVNNTCRLHEQ